MTTQTVGIWGGVFAVAILIGGLSIWAFTNGPLVPPPQAAGTSTPPVETQATTTPEKESTVAALNERILDNGVHITPLEVLEDSRCPMGVYCIQAGTVRIKAKLEGPSGTQVVTMVMGSPVSFGSKHVTLMSVAPPKSQAKAIAPSDYRFTFSVSFGMGEETPAGTLSGTMTIGPICPVEQVDNPCKPAPEMYAARKVAVYASDKKTLIDTLTPDANGKFSTDLAPGTYYVAMANSTSGGVGSTSGVPTTIVIKSGETTTLHIDIDTGIR